MFPTKIFSERLISVRKSRNIPAKAVADALGLSKAAISQFESGKNAPSSAVLLALADFFNISLDYLVGRSDDPTRH
ncbi:MAG: helix-turn-helix transcriptional regulator [Oscillospiraceae bacterium]|nr:helix-turn-helix transcriptional regulator [Oscillospiraceae bacterium]